MREFTTQEQTAKLIELGFPKPKFEIETHIVSVHGAPIKAATIIGDYSIGELVSFLSNYKLEIDNTDSDDIWMVSVHDTASFRMYDSVGKELVDALFNACVELKKG